ncbi:hypothetical protein BOTBODRAFT_123015, partial [Botryobasidium botryosum FD-172 SS1]
MAGHYGTLQCDGWKNVKKNHLLAFMVSAAGEVRCTHVHNVSAARKNATALLDMMKDELGYNEATLGVVNIGACSDASGESRAARSRLLAQMPHLLVVDCYSHQIQLIVGDYLKKNPTVSLHIQQLTDVANWFNNHSFALGLLAREQATTRTIILVLLMPNLTRWTTHSLSVDRFLDLEGDLKSVVAKQEANLVVAAGTKAKAKAKAREIIGYIKNESLWNGLRPISEHLQPLAVASLATQGIDTRPDIVILVLGKLYKIYSDILQRDGTKTEANSAHPLFICALYLNPLVSFQIFNGNVIPPLAIWGMCAKLYKRVFRAEVVPDCFATEIRDYHYHRGAFSDEFWNSDFLAALYAEQAIPLQDPLEIWRAHYQQNPITKLAVLILSFVCNSAGCERLFSTKGDIHTKKRNRLGPQKVRDTAVVKMDIRREHAQRGLVRQRLKRRFMKEPAPT